MTRFFRLFLTMALIAFTSVVQAQAPLLKPSAQGSDLSDSQKKTKLGKLPRKNEIDVHNLRLKQLLPKIDYKLGGRKSLPFLLYRARIEIQLLDQSHDGWVIQTQDPPSWWNKGYLEAFPLLPFYPPKLDYSNHVSYLMEKWIPKYKKYLKNKSGTDDNLSPEQLQQQVWHWLAPREKAEQEARIRRLEEELARDLKSIRKIRDRLTEIKAERIRKEDIKKNKDKKEETIRERKEGGSTGRTATQQAPPKLACDLQGGEWHSGTLAQVRQITTNWKKAFSSCKAGTDLCRASRGAISFGAYMDTLAIWQCHATFLKQSKKISDEDRKLARAEGCATGKALEEIAEQIKANGFMTVGTNWKPFHINLSEKWELEDLCDAGKIEEAKPKDDCESSGGLIGTINCVTKRIDEAGGSDDNPPTSTSPVETKTEMTAKSVKKPDETPAVPKADKNGEMLSEETVDKEPTFASSTDKITGITIKSVRNADGTRTVTTTDKDGKVLKQKKVR